MSNIVHFPSAAAAVARASGHLGSRLLSEPPAHAHAVQFYDDEPFLLETVAFFVSEGLAAGDRALIVATPQHTDGIMSRIDKAVRERALAEGELLLVDADALLERFMRADEPVESLFEAAIEHVLASLQASKRPGVAAPPRARRLRAFGEMVNLLWKRGNPTAALWLEEYWNRACARYDLALLCGYEMRNFYRTGDTVPFGEVCRLHTHVMPTEHFAKDGGDVFERLREISVLEQRARRLDSEVAYREALEGALRATLDDRPHAMQQAAPRAATALLAAPDLTAQPLPDPSLVAPASAPSPSAASCRTLPASLPSRLAKAVAAARARLARGVARHRARR